VLITSTQASALTLGSPTQVDVFTERESLDFLTERTKLHDPDGAKTLAAELGHLPLALAQAAAVIRAQRLSYPVYLTRLRDYPTQKYLPPAKGDRYPRGVAEAIGLSIDAVTATDPSGVCGDLLATISLLSPEGVSRDLLYGNDRAGAAEIDEALSRLADASLLAFSGEDGSEPIVTAHRLVMRVTRERHAHDGTLTAVGTKACGLVAAASESLGEPWQHRAAARDLVRQVIALNDHLAPHIGPADRALAENLLFRRGLALWCLCLLADSALQAVDLGEPLVADLDRVLGESHPETLMSRNDLAVAHCVSGRAGDAIPLLEVSLAGLERVLGVEHPSTVTVRGNLARARREVEGRGNSAAGA